MKKVFSLVLVLALAFSVAPAFAQDGLTEQPAMQKLGRGLLNIADGIVEIPGTMMRTGSTDGAGKAMTVGLFEGLKNTVVRIGVGLYETVTFPFPVPADYEPILDDPQFLATE